MSFKTQPAFFFDGDFGPESRSHPAIKWMEDYTVNTIDAQKWSLPYSDYHTDDFSVLKPDSEEVTGGESAWQAIAKLYGNFTAFKHEPVYCACKETSYGWKMIGHATVYVNLPGSPSAGEQKVKDLSGREWDGKVPGGFTFEYKKDPSAKVGGIKLQRSEIYSDSGPALLTLLKRGVIKPADMGL